MFENVKINSDRWFNLNNLLNEEWKDIEDYKGLYKVSNYGRIKSLKRISYDKIRDKTRQISEKILKQSIASPGYYIVNLTKDSKQRVYRIHRLVAEAFIPNPNNYPVINHIDGNKNNNIINNLEWCTYKHNSNEAIKKRFNRLQL